MLIPYAIQHLIGQAVAGTAPAVVTGRSMLQGHCTQLGDSPASLLKPVLELIAPAEPVTT